MNIRDLSACLLASIILCQYQSVCGYDVIQSRPIPRGGLWLIDQSATMDFNGDGLNCGGYLNHWIKNNGSCGPCGDDASYSLPRPHENRGIYSEIAYRTMFRQYSIAEIKVLVPSEAMNANYSFHICHLRDIRRDNETEACFENYKLDFAYPPPGRIAAVGQQNRRGLQSFYVRLPLTIMSRAVLRTTVTTAKNFGICPNKQLGNGCGKGKELFRICANIEIRPFYFFNIPDYDGIFTGN